MMRNLALGLLLSLPVAAAAYPNSSTTCSAIGSVNYCSSGNSRGFNGQQYGIGDTLRTEGYHQGRRVVCDSYQLGHSIKTDCN